MLAVSSGKGGVGKSTVSANLAVAMAAEGRRVGLMDTDIYGPNIPGMLGVSGRAEAVPGTQRIRPAEAAGVRVISMGLLVDAGVPVIWRGPHAGQDGHPVSFLGGVGGARRPSARPASRHRGRAAHPDADRASHRRRHRHHAVDPGPGGRGPGSPDVPPDRCPHPRSAREHGHLLVPFLRRRQPPLRTRRRGGGRGRTGHPLPRGDPPRPESAGRCGRGHAYRVLPSRGRCGDRPSRRRPRAARQAGTS